MLGRRRRRARTTAEGRRYEGEEKLPPRTWPWQIVWLARRRARLGDEAHQRRRCRQPIRRARVQHRPVLVVWWVADGLCRGGRHHERCLPWQRPDRLRGGMLTHDLHGRRAEQTQIRLLGMMTRRRGGRRDGGGQHGRGLHNRASRLLHPLGLEREESCRVGHRLRGRLADPRLRLFKHARVGRVPRDAIIVVALLKGVAARQADGEDDGSRFVPACV